MPVHCRATHTDTSDSPRVELLSQSSGVSLRRHVEARRADKERYNKTAGDKRQQGSYGRNVGMRGAHWKLL